LQEIRNEITQAKQKSGLNYLQRAMDVSRPEMIAKKRGSIPPIEDKYESTNPLNDLEPYTSNPFIAKPASPQH